MNPLGLLKAVSAMRGAPLNLYPGDRGVAGATRHLDGDEMVWRWGPYRNRLRRHTEPRA